MVANGHEEILRFIASCDGKSYAASEEVMPPKLLPNHITRTLIGIHDIEPTKANPEMLNNA